MEARLGTLLVEAGVLTNGQAMQILTRQETTGEPFGVLAEAMFGVDPAAVEGAWIRQYAKRTTIINPLHLAVDPSALACVTARQAWQFRVLPFAFADEGGELFIATTRPHLKRAFRFSINVVGMPCIMRLADPDRLGLALQLHFPLPGLAPETVGRRLTP